MSLEMEDINEDLLETIIGIILTNAFEVVAQHNLLVVNIHFNIFIIYM